MIKDIFKKGNRVYLDNAASTPVDPRVARAMKPYLNKYYGNAGSLHFEGRASKKALNDAREVFRSTFSAHDNEFIFTGSGTESNNIAILGTINALEKNGMSVSDMHLITSVIEHPSVLDVFKSLESRGASVTYLNVDENGIVDLYDLKKELTDKTVLISMMYVNNEIGVIEPIPEIVKVVKKFRGDKSMPFVHTDASQAWLLPAIDIHSLGVDLLTLDAQKIYGPKGVGALYVKAGHELQPVIIGGNQEFGIRPGTENIPVIVGFAKALSLVREFQEKESKRLEVLRDYFISLLQKEIEGIEFNGPMGGDIDKRIANNVNFSLPGVDNEFVAVYLDEKGISIGTRSACIVGEGKSSYVIKALGKSDEVAQSSLRFSLGKYTKKKDIDRTVKELKNVLEKCKSV